MIGAFLFEGEWRSWDEAAAARALARLADLGVDCVVTESDDARDDVIEWAHAHGLRWIAAIACFSDHASGERMLQADPALWPIDEHGERRRRMEWYIGLSPASADLRERRAAAAERLVREHDVDGLFLDFVRWPLHWELECRDGARPATGSFDDAAVSGFVAQSGVEVPSGLDLAARARWILKHALAEWDEYRCRLITEFVDAVGDRVRRVRPISTGAFLVPVAPAAAERLVGQRPADLAQAVDWLAPMTYHGIALRRPGWIEEIVRPLERIAPGRVLPLVQIDSEGGTAVGADWGPPLSDSQAREAIGVATAAAASRSLVMFPGAALFDQARGDALAPSLSR